MENSKLGSSPSKAARSKSRYSMPVNEKTSSKQELVEVAIGTTAVFSGFSNPSFSQATLVEEEAISTLTVSSCLALKLL